MSRVSDSSDSSDFQFVFEVKAIADCLCLLCSFLVYPCLQVLRNIKGCQAELALLRDSGVSSASQQLHKQETIFIH
jgi:hypothetical protein